MTRYSRMNDSIRMEAARYVVLAGAAWLLCGAGMEFYAIAWGTGNWLGQLSIKWFLAFLLFVITGSIVLGGIGIILWAPQKLIKPAAYFSVLRDKLGIFRWLFIVFLITFPIYFLQYTYWGIVLHGPYVRVLISVISAILLGWLLTGANHGLLSWNAILIALILIAGLYTFWVPLIGVTSYPFSLGWSEGNRIWDYSILFGSHLYNYPADQKIPVYLDIGRQFVGGIPFLISGITIWEVRLWIALTELIPYLILGFIAFRLPKKNGLPWMLAGIWAFTFVEQGPIHPPLLICAIIVALAWRRPLWLAIPLIAAASFFAFNSRTTWLFAPGMWAVMLEMGDAFPVNNKLDKKVWGRAIGVGLAGIFGGYLAPFLNPARIIQWFSSRVEQSTVGSNVPVESITTNSGVTITSVQAQVSDQALLWYRLFPNATFGPGILIGLLLASLPLIAILVYLVKNGHWKLNGWQKFSIVAPLLAFLIVGLIVSVKIGGGGDLHNMDMFIIGLMFAGALAWQKLNHRELASVQAFPIWIRMSFIALIAIPAYKPLTLMSPISTSKDIQLVVRLADITPADPLPNPLPGTLPSKVDTANELESIRQAVLQAASTGDVLFMDQRQLLTFGFIKDVPLIPEYDKKVLIDKALSQDAGYFQGFYQDLSVHRFSLIITSPLSKRLDDSEHEFGEENNSWVEWVAKPLLCYYQPIATFKKVNVQLLTPRGQTSDCEASLPN